MQSPHVLAIPYPAQGHVIPLLELMQCLARHGVKITFVNTEFNQERVANALSRKDDIGDHIHLISIPDGLEAGDDRNDVLKLMETISQFMPGKLVELIEKINESGDKITCIIADQVVGWALEIAEKMHIRRAAFWPAAATLLGLSISIPKLLDDGIIDDNGKNLVLTLDSSATAQGTVSDVGSDPKQKKSTPTPTRCRLQAHALLAGRRMSSHMLLREMTHDLLDPDLGSF